MLMVDFTQFVQYGKEYSLSCWQSQIPTCYLSHENKVASDDSKTTRIRKIIYQSSL